ncbi:MAG: TonB-dependent receptor [Prolixibacteraceae bacterium]
MKKKFKDREVLPQNFLSQLFLIMKLTLFFLITSVLGLFATESYSQMTRITLDLKSVTVKDALKAIENESQFFFIYNNELINVDREIDISVKNEKITEVLNTIFEGRNVEVTVIDRKIVLAPAFMGEQQTGKKISGKVTDSSGGTLPGVSVIVKGTTNGVISDNSGNYLLTNVLENATLQFSFVGMKTQEIAVGNKISINITLEEETVGIDEVVAIGYGVQKKSSLTGSVSSVAGEKLAVAKSTNFTNSLVGRLPGLVAVQRSGQPGSDDTTLRIRGNNTLNDNSPLIVVDGIANRSMSRLSSSDIESVTVLKDASAAIYGAQAANGVILITTKRGSIGKLKVDIEFNQGFSSPTILPKMADSFTYASMMNEVDLYSGQTPRYSTVDLQKYKDGSDPWAHPNTNWFKEVFKPIALLNDANMNLSGGTENLKYFVSVGTKYQDGAFKQSGVNFSQIDFRSNIDAKISNNISLNIDIAGRQEKRRNTIYPEGETFRQIPRGKPTDVAWWSPNMPGPDIETDYNPVVMVTNLGGEDRDTRYIMESNLKLNIIVPGIKGLSITGNASFDKSFLNDKIWKIPFYLYVWDKVTLDAGGLPVPNGSKRGVSQPQLTQSNQTGGRTTLNALINYERKINDRHKIKLLVGSEYSTGITEAFSASRKYFISSAINQLFAGGDLDKDNTGTASETARLNYFGRVNYDYLSKYLVEFVWRYDGSFIFPADKRWGFFPGASVGWILSEENFWKNNVSFLNYFKLRGSWGQTGNDRISAFQYLSTYKFGTGWGGLESGLNLGEWVTNGTNINKVLYEQSIPNQNVTWEVATQTNVGFDAKMLGGKLKLEADFFHNLRSKILTQRNASVPASAGLTLPPENIGEVVNQGFEFVLSYGNKMSDFGYNVSLNGGYAKNKIKYWDETPGIPEYQKTTGFPMNSMLYYQAIGIFNNQAEVDAYPHWVGARPGDIIFKDVNEDGKISSLDMVRDYRSDIPTFTSGLNLDLTYKNFYATLLFQGSWGKIRYHNVESGSNGNYYMEDSDGRWTADNLDATKPRTFNYTAEYWRSQYNTYWLRSADYVRLKNIEVGYNLPQSLNAKLRIDGLRLYVGGINLLTWCPTLPSFDPESVYQNYPLSKVINVGVKITF